MLFKQTEDTYQNALLVGFQLYQETGIESYLKTMFEINEKSKGRLLFSVVRDMEAQKVTLSDDLLEKEKELVKELALIKGELNKEHAQEEQTKDKIRVKSLESQYFDIYLKYEQLVKDIENANQNYYKLKYNVGTINIDNLQTNLADNNTLIEYFITEDSLYIFYISKNNYGIKHVKTSINWKEKTEELSKHIQCLNFQFAAMAFELYQLLVQPIENKFTKESKLIIIPDRHLFSIPFEVLLSNKVNEDEDYSAFPYFLNNCKSISYHYSATLWSHTPKYKKTSQFSFAGFAPKYDNTSKYKNLPHSERELKAIAELLQKKTDQVHLFLNEKATVPQFIQVLEKNKYDVIHIAAHGFQNRLFPSQSGIVFTNDKLNPLKKIKTLDKEEEIMRSLTNDEYTENKFYLDHTLALRLDTQLMVLNFCNSGDGKAVQGEGMMAMNRSFLYAGVKNIIYTLMKVNDKDAYELSCLLYQYILSDMTYTEALHQAKIDFAKKEGTSPKSWCGFLYIGR